MLAHLFGCLSKALKSLSDNLAKTTPDVAELEQLIDTAAEMGTDAVNAEKQQEEDDDDDDDDDDKTQTQKQSTQSSPTSKITRSRSSTLSSSASSSASGVVSMYGVYPPSGVTSNDETEIKQQLNNVAVANSVLTLDSTIATNDSFTFLATANMTVEEASNFTTQNPVSVEDLYPELSF